MTSKQRAYLKSLAGNLEPVFQIGKGSLTPEVTQAIAEAFNKKELIKVTVLKNCFDDPNQLGAMLAERTQSQLVQVIGRKIVLYKESKEHKKINSPDKFPEQNTEKPGVRRVGIMGGTFNPIHIGHLLLAENAYSAFGLDQVLFIPSGCSYMKEQSGILDPDTRLRMTSLAVADNPHFQVSDIEIRRPGYTYTCETLEQLERENPGTEFFFLAGADSLFAMETWKNPEIIFQKATVLAAVRDDCGNSRLSEQAERLREKYHGRICLIPSGNVEISSSDIRSRIQEGRSIRYLVPERVREYIEENGLYRQAAGKAGEEISK